MTVVPLPDTPCIRVRPFGNVGTDYEWGNRFYFSYSGSAPTAANCATLASDIQTLWGTHLSPLQFGGYALDEVDVLDIASDSGASGNWQGTLNGTRSGAVLPIQTAANVQFSIARRYRGGKPRAYFNFGVDADLAAVNSWTTAFVAAVSSAVADFFAGVEALSVGSIGTLQHVNLSYYQGFKNITNSSGRERAAPTYRATAKSDIISGYVCKDILGSQRRRRTSTSA